MLRTVKQTLVLLRNSPRFSIPAILMLAGGIILSGGCYAILEAAVFRAIPYEAPQYLVQIVKRVRQAAIADGNLSRADFELLKNRAYCFETLGYEIDSQGSIAEKKGRVLPIKEAKVSQGLLQTLRVRPKLGRLLQRSDFDPSAPAAIVLSFNLWNSFFAGDPGILGQHATIDGRDSVVIGIMPETVRPPVSVADLWIPDASPFAGSEVGANSDKSDKYVVARLGGALSLPMAEREISLLQPVPIPGLRNISFASDSFHLLSLTDQLVGSTKRVLQLLLFACLSVQLLACLNVGHLLVARRISKVRDLGIRLALGSSTAKLCLEVLSETLAVASLALLCGMAVLIPLLPAAAAVASVVLQSPIHAHLSASILIFCVSLALVSCLLCSVIPMLLLRRLDALALINARWDAGPLSLVASHLQDLLIVAQVAAAVVLMLGSGLLLKSLYRLSEVSLGFQPARLSYALFGPSSIKFPASGFRLHEAIQQLSRLPAVQSAAIGSTPLLVGAQMNLGVAAQADDGRWIDIHSVILQSVSSGYFAALGVPLLSGRIFNEHDTSAAPCVAIVNQTFARFIWPTDNAAGKRIDTSGGGGSARQPCEIVGIVGDARDVALARQPEPELFFSDLQKPAAANAVILLRKASRQTISIETVRRIVAVADPTREFDSSMDVGVLVDTALSPATTRLKVFGGLALMALLLAIGGTYAAVTFGLNLRTKEIGVRLAMGASLAQIASLVYRHYARLSIIGGLLGVAAGGAMSRVFSSGVALFEVEHYDPAVFLLVPILCVIVVLASVVMPVFRAARIDPGQSLRVNSE